MLAHIYAGSLSSCTPMPMHAYAYPALLFLLPALQAIIKSVSRKAHLCPAWH
jgi:hypothetical protein